MLLAQRRRPLRERLCGCGGAATGLRVRVHVGQPQPTWAGIAGQGVIVYLKYHTMVAFVLPFANTNAPELHWAASDITEGNPI